VNQSRAVSASDLLAGTKLRIKITNKGWTFSAIGKVAYSIADGDTGIVFARVEPSDQMILEKWIGELRAL
jgi:hypothetical protein